MGRIKNDYLISPKFMRENFSYHNGGYLIRKSRIGGGTKPGQLVKGGKKGKSYRVMILQNKQVRLHRAIFSLVHGFLPEIVDHINGDIHDNRIENLRALASYQNSHNVKKKDPRNKSGHRGVYFNPCRNSWTGRILVNGKLFFTKYSKDKNLVVAELKQIRKKIYGEIFA